MFLQDQSRCAFWQNNRYIHIFQVGSEGNSPQKPKKYKKWRLNIFMHQIVHTRRVDISCNDVDSDTCWGGGGVRIFFLLKWCNLARSECSQIRYYQPKNQQFQGKFSTMVNVISPISHQYLGPSINGLVTDGNTKLCCRGFILALFQSTMYSQ